MECLMCRRKIMISVVITKNSNIIKQTLWRRALTHRVPVYLLKNWFSIAEIIRIQLQQPHYTCTYFFYLQTETALRWYWYGFSNFNYADGSSEICATSCRMIHIHISNWNSQVLEIFYLFSRSYNFLFFVHIKTTETLTIYERKAKIWYLWRKETWWEPCILYIHCTLYTVAVRRARNMKQTNESESTQWR